METHQMIAFYDQLPILTIIRLRSNSFRYVTRGPPSLKTGSLPLWTKR
jgi:hypothetical protein